MPVHGRFVLAAHQRADLVLRTRTAYESRRVAAGLWVFATIDSPAGIVAEPIAIAPSRVRVLGVAGTSEQSRRRRACLAALLSNHHYDCSSQLGLSEVR